MTQAPDVVVAARDGRLQPEPVLSCRDLRKSLAGRLVVDGLSFEVAGGEAFGLLGPNGAGKTTTIRMVCGILAPDSGQIGVRGAPGPVAVGYVPQNLALFPTLTVTENLRFWARLYRVPRRLRPERIEHALRLTHLTDQAADRLERCSGGMQRRLNLAVALLPRPGLLVLDEPTVGVDAPTRTLLLEALARLRDQGTAILFTSHYIDDVERLCDRVGVVDHGRMVVFGEPSGLLREHPQLTDLEGLYLHVTGRELRD